MRFCIYVLSYQLSHVSHICFTFYHYINHWFIMLLCKFCMMNVVRIWQGNIVLRNISDVTDGVHWVQLHRPREKSCSFKKEYKEEIFHLVLPHFNFWLAIEKYFYVPISTDCQNNSKRIIQRWHLFDRDVIAVVWFRQQGVLKNSAKLTGKHLCWSLFSCSSFCSLWGNMVEMDPSVNFRGRPFSVK